MNAPRLVDLHCDWLLQYVPDCTVFDPAHYPEIARAAAGKEGPAYFGQSDGYLTGTSAAVMACFRTAADWASQAHPWAALGDLIARIEAEFPGRILATPDDHARWLDDANGLCWAVIGVEGFDALVRESTDLDRLPSLFERGVRVFQPIYGSSSLLGGSAETGDERGLTDLGRAFLDALASLATQTGPRPILDLAHMNPQTQADVLAWFESDASRAARVLPAYSHGALRHDAFPSPRAITPENLARLRALGGTIGFSVAPPFYDTPERLRESIETAAATPFLGEPGYAGLALGTDYLGVSQALPGLRNVEELAAWAFQTFPPEVATSLLSGPARSLLARAAGLPK